ncbi:MAG: glycosyl transferase [Saprospiraceae bacterium]|nr:glycosyl transferase [Saprospiraceae bacterium]
MKILYSVQATGNGHISRAHQLYPYLCALGQVDILLSGSNATLQMDIPIKFRAQGMSLFYSECGGLDYIKTFKAFSYNRIKREAQDLPVKNYDLIINDFDHITARACKIHDVPSVQFGHQASFMSNITPRPESKSIIGEAILKYYAPAKHFVGLHFERYEQFIFPAVIKDTFLQCKPSDQGHITVYLPSYDKICLEEILREVAPLDIHWFTKEITEPHRDGNIHYYPVSQKYFNESLIHCHGLLTGGGFETPAEALYLGKKLLTIPIKGQYEQACNAAALEKMGVLKMNMLNQNTKQTFFDWLKSSNKSPKIEANDINETLEFLLNMTM